VEKTSSQHRVEELKMRTALHTESTEQGTRCPTETQSSRERERERLSAVRPLSTKRQAVEHDRAIKSKKEAGTERKKERERIS
jgi:hypothetical protein